MLVSFDAAVVVMAIYNHVAGLRSYSMVDTTLINLKLLWPTLPLWLEVFIIMLARLHGGYHWIIYYYDALPFVVACYNLWLKLADSWLTQADIWLMAVLLNLAVKCYNQQRLEAAVIMSMIDTDIIVIVVAFAVWRWFKCYYNHVAEGALIMSIFDAR
jgi:hypothetical protein